MNNQDAINFGKMLSAIGEIYNKTISKELTRMYWNALKHYSFDNVSLAFNRHVTNPDNGQFMPKPADIVRFLNGSSETNSMLAWTKVMTAITGVGSHQDVVFDDPIIHQVISDMGGWIDLCSHTYKEMEFKANEFNKRYVRYKNFPKSEYPKRLSGSANIHNSAENLSLEKPRLIGDQAQAELVYKGGADNVKKIGTLGESVLKLVESKKAISNQ